MQFEWNPEKAEANLKKMDENDLELLPEYDFDYEQSKPNRFAVKYRQTQQTVVSDNDVAESFPSAAESVNEARRFLVRVTRENKAGRRHE